MDFSAITLDVLKSFWWFIPLVIIIGLFQSPWGKGYLGELQVRLYARFRLDRAIYPHVYNVTLPTPDGTTQIDHLFVSRYGVFVLETKNMRGWIYGGAHQAQWTQKLFKQTFKFQNPLWQNVKHVKAIEATLRIPADTIHSVVTFVGGSTFKTEMPNNVTQGGGFVPYIKSFREPVFTEEQVSDLLANIASGRKAPTLATHREHVQQLKTRSNPNADRRCPKCGNPLVIRTLKTGERAGQQFWGCSTYPKCRVVQSIT